MRGTVRAAERFVGGVSIELTGRRRRRESGDARGCSPDARERCSDGASLMHGQVIEMGQ